MKALKREIEENAQYLGNGIIKADAFINHQLLPKLTTDMGLAFAEKFREAGVTGVNRIVTAEVSGIAPALVVAQAMDVPMVFARKKKPAFMTGGLFSAHAQSRTKAEAVTLYISDRFLGPQDKVVIIDDFLATASTLKALVSIVADSGAQLVGMGCVIEKVFEGGREKLAHLNIPIISLARIDLVEQGQSFIVS
ncbi:MAG: xanthine phosphoribosyltransferase [Desulfobacterium sp.]